MRVSWLPFLGASVFFLSPAWTQTTSALVQAQQEADRLKDSVAAGVLPPVRLQQAQQTLLDAQDEAVLKSTLYSAISVQELTEQQAQDMVAAAERRVARQKQANERLQALVNLGAVARAQMTPLRDELAMRERTLELARTRAKLMEELAEMAKVEHVVEEDPLPVANKIAEKFDGKGTMQDNDFLRVASAFQRQFNRILPVSAYGETATHKAMGFDHRGRVDIALNPDQPEGVWLRNYLRTTRIPYFAFRSFIPGKATAPHIHLGPPSLRYKPTDGKLPQGS